MADETSSNQNDPHEAETNIDADSVARTMGQPGEAEGPTDPAAQQNVVSRGTGTAVSVLIGGLIGTAASLVMFAILYLAVSHTSKLHLFFWRDPIVPFATTMLFFWALAILVLKVRHIHREQRAFDLELLPTDPYHLITTRDIQATLRTINAMPQEQRQLTLITRISRALRRVRASGNSGEIAEFLEYQANIDAATVESTYAAVKVFIWAIPVVGFIGTVLGISLAIGNFGELVQEAGDVEQIKTGLGPVTGGLAVAFETTLLALVYSIIVMFFSTYIHKKEDDFLTEVEDFCVEHLLNKLAIGDDKFVSELNEAFSEAQEEGMRKQAEVVETALAELQTRQLEALKELSQTIDKSQVESVESFTAALRSLFEETGGQQATRLSELGHRFERGLQNLSESVGQLQGSNNGESSTTELLSNLDGDQAQQLVTAFSQQAEELRETRHSIQNLAKSLEHLATLEPFQDVLTNIQKALDLLIPAVDELKQPRELRITEAHIPPTRQEPQS